MRALRIALNIGSVVLVAVLGWTIVRIIMGVTTPASLYVANPIAAPNTGVAARTSDRTYSFASDPFTFGETLPQNIELVEDAPETTLNLKLKGVVSESSATFRVADGKDKVFEVSEEVMNGVTLTRTAKDFVLLDVNGEAQKLTLERVKLDAKQGKPLIGRAAAPSKSLPSRAEAENLFDKIQLTPSLEILPNGKTRRQGFIIKARSGADLSKFGLRSGDVVTRIGPVLLNTNRTNIKELRELVSSGAAQDIEVLRGGAPVTIRIGQ